MGRNRVCPNFLRLAKTDNAAQRAALSVFAFLYFPAQPENKERRILDQESASSLSEVCNAWDAGSCSHLALGEMEIARPKCTAHEPLLCDKTVLFLGGLSSRK
jgi:hypothetical protein